MEGRFGRSKRRNRSPSRRTGQARVFAVAARAIHALSGHLRLRRSYRARRLHAPRPRRAAQMDLRDRLQGGPGAFAAHARPARRAARDLSRLRALPHQRRDFGRHRVCPAVVFHGDRDRRRLCRLRRAYVDAGGVLRRGRFGDRHHCDKRLQAHHEEHRQGQAPVGDIPRCRSGHHHHRIGDRLDLPGLGRPRVAGQGAAEELVQRSPSSPNRRSPGSSWSRASSCGWSGRRRRTGSTVAAGRAWRWRRSFRPPPAWPRS